MAENEKDKVKSIIAAVSSALSNSKISLSDSKEIFDSAKIEAHSAITPTTLFPNSLSDEEQELYDIILKRFCAVFCTDDYVVNRTNAVIDKLYIAFLLSDITWI